ncbi:uncharacterized protein CC84DRAFT_1204754 [Paraphaeosphaeria sporulosa]|uniref:BTB domain-containing protein n=1 Tax=Paraphaeosphaeria sporulosa TaxID=1460663 RepID=A0A177CI43_9PLEO|nr:uncharacterized protein CC84DRAFT_1204754 [Paraphaeosphaeria sporulosa]OAG07184.1 hypothetical protein CC84DRAFT_1204754 [Paraphaeosphaeria sporulosa]
MSAPLLRIFKFYFKLLRTYHSELATQGTSGLVTVKIASDEKSYTLYKDMLTHYSKYFKKALKGEWKEAQGGAVVLGDVDSVIFELFVNWKQQQKIHLDFARASLKNTKDDWSTAPAHEDDEDDEEEDNNSTTPESIEHDDLFGLSPFDIDLVLLLQGSIFADRFLMSDFKDALLYAFVDEIIAMPPASFKFIIFADKKGLLPGSGPVLDLLADAHCKSWRVDSSEDDVQLIDDLPKKFTRHLIFRGGLLNQGAGAPGDELIACDYHGHATQAEFQGCAARKSRVLVSGPDIV